MEEKTKVVEFYLHKLVLIYLTIWDPNPYLGDAKLLALTFRLRHEEVRAEEVIKIMDWELRETLWIKLEYANSFIITLAHALLVEYPQVVEGYK